MPQATIYVPSIETFLLALAAVSAVQLKATPGFLAVASLKSRREDFVRSSFSSQASSSLTVEIRLCVAQRVAACCCYHLRPLALSPRLSYRSPPLLQLHLCDTVPLSLPTCLPVSSALPLLLIKRGPWLDVRLVFFRWRLSRPTLTLPSPLPPRVHMDFSARCQEL